MVHQQIMKRPGKQPATGCGSKIGILKPVFGRSLQEVYEVYGGLPSVFWDNLRLLSLQALMTPGLFRPQPTGRHLSQSSTTSSSACEPGQTGSGSSSDGGSSDGGSGAAHQGPPTRKVLLCRRLYDSGQDALKVLPSTSKDVHTIAGILKLWVRALPEAVVPPSLHAAALATQTDHPGQRGAQVAALHALLRQCEHRVLQVLYPLMEFLHHYCLNQRQPAQERAELARIFAPLVLRPAGESVMTPPEDGGLSAQCVEHMIREYRTMFVPRKRAIVPPSLPSCGGKTAAAVAATAPPALAAVAEVEGLRTDPTEVAPVRAGLAPLNTQGAAAAAAAAAIEQGAYDALPDSPGGGESTGQDPCADAQLDKAMSALLFSSTSVLFEAEAPQQAQSRENFYSVSPTDTPHGSPLRPRDTPEGAAPAGRKEGASNPLASPVSVSAGWGRTTSDVSSDDSGCDDNATDAASRRSFDSTPPGRGNAGGDETAAHSRPAAAPPPQREQPRERSQARRPVEEAAEDEACFALAAAGAREAARPALQDGARGEPGGPFQPPSSEVEYEAAALQDGGGQQAGVTQLAAEKAALKRQLRQLDADFAASTGRAPERAEKEALRPLYVRYWRLKRALAEASSSGPTAPASPRPAMRSIMMEA